MKKVLAILLAFSFLLLFLWLSKQRANSVEGGRAAHDYLLHGKYSEAIPLFEQQAGGNNIDSSLARIGLLQALLDHGTI